MKTNLLTFILFIFSAINLFSCNFNKKEIKNNPTEPIDSIAENATSTREFAQEDINKDDKPKVGESIYGDFDGNGTYEYAYIELTKKGNGGNPIDGDGIPDEYAIKFTDKTFPIFSFYPGCCETLLINEGDLNNDGSDEISLFHAPMNGCCYDWMTLTLHNGKWEQLIDMLFYALVVKEYFQRMNYKTLLLLKMASYIKTLILVIPKMRMDFIVNSKNFQKKKQI